MKYALLTAIYDGYDTLKELAPQDVDAEAICVTDDPNLRSDTWTIVHEPRPSAHPNLAAKRPKTKPWLYTDADIVVWIDASLIVRSPSFVNAMLKYLPFGQFDHPERDCIYDETLHSVAMPKYADQPLRDQANHYRTTGHPDHWGLWATGLIVREHTPQIEAFGDAWLAECERWSFQDQISEAPMLRKHKLRPTTIPGFVGVQQNPWVGYAASARH